MQSSKITSMVTVLGVALALSSMGSASAATWKQTHPRRAEVNARLAHQNTRIRDERREGDLTASQAADLHAEDRGIRAQERFDASQDGGHITKAEKAQLNHEENGVSQQIGR